MHLLTAFAVNYDTPIRSAGDVGYPALAQRLLADLPPKWDVSYRDMCSRATNVLAFVDRGMFFHFDLGSRNTRSRKKAPEGRIVVVYGLSHYQFVGRDEPRIKAFLSQRLRTAAGRPMDKGHFASRRQGGGLDVNLFPQHPEVNRGWSPRGKVFDELERYCVAHAGTFFFARPIYGDQTRIPHAIEYGVLEQSKELRVERVLN